MEFFDYNWMPHLIAQSLSERIYRGLQKDLNENYNRFHRVCRDADVCENEVIFSIALPDGKRKKYKIKVNEIKKNKNEKF
ncbi:MAG: hypothetical protein AABY22_33690 [Nanoarchaeota archaeon]